MLRSNLVKPEKVILEEVAKPKPKKNEVLIATKTAGICGSDVHAYYGKHPFIHCPIVQGHEFSGVVAELGPGVKGLKVGQRVTVVPLLTCGTCYNCKRGDYNRCATLKFIGCQSNGAMADYVPVPAKMVVPLPDSIDFDTAALIEPLAVGIHAARRSNVKKGSKVLVLGAGPIGLVTCQAAKAFGAAKVVVSDRIPFRLNMARKLGADGVINVAKESLDKGVKRSFGEDGADVIFECVGVATTIQAAIKVARKGSQIIVVGVFGTEVPVKVGYIQDHELEIRGTAGYVKEDFEEAIRLIQRKKVNVNPLITDRFPLREIQKAYKTIERNREQAIKVLIQVSK
ncbi:MAG: alcohol dehydrogenase catalytic domain-containing protein [bacterium]|nr:alcohol dehydrogenase catalytic domain-containing protein [bacterium]